MSYTPNFRDHYWIVAGDSTRVWSSKNIAYVSVSNAEYLAWRAIGYIPSTINSTGELLDVLQANWIPLIFANGIEITSTATPSISGIYSLADKAINQMVAIATGISAGKQLPGGGSTFNYPDLSNSMHAFTAPDFLNFGIAIENYIYSCTQALHSLLNDELASFPQSSITIP
jgi:hypothetical protein